MRPAFPKSSTPPVARPTPCATRPVADAALRLVEAHGTDAMAEARRRARTAGGAEDLSGWARWRSAEGLIRALSDGCAAAH